MSKSEKCFVSDEQILLDLCSLGNDGMGNSCSMLLLNEEAQKIAKKKRRDKRKVDKIKKLRAELEGLCLGKKWSLDTLRAKLSIAVCMRAELRGKKILSKIKKIDCQERENRKIIFSEDYGKIEENVVTIDNPVKILELEACSKMEVKIDATCFVTVKQSEIHPFVESFPLKGGGKDLNTYYRETPYLSLLEWLQNTQEKDPRIFYESGEDDRGLYYRCSLRFSCHDRKYVLNSKRRCSSEQQALNDVCIQALLEVFSEIYCSEDVLVVSVEDRVNKHCFLKGMGVPLSRCFQNKGVWFCELSMREGKYGKYIGEGRDEDEAIAFAYDSLSIALGLDSISYDYIILLRKIVPENLPVSYKEGWSGKDGSKRWMSSCLVKNFKVLSSRHRFRHKARMESSMMMIDVFMLCYRGEDEEDIPMYDDLNVTHDSNRSELFEKVQMELSDTEFA